MKRCILWIFIFSFALTQNQTLSIEDSQPKTHNSNNSNNELSQNPSPQDHLEMTSNQSLEKHHKENTQFSTQPPKQFAQQLKNINHSQIHAKAQQNNQSLHHPSSTTIHNQLNQQQQNSINDPEITQKNQNPTLSEVEGQDNSSEIKVQNEQRQQHNQQKQQHSQERQRQAKQSAAQHSNNQTEQKPEIQEQKKTQQQQSSPQNPQTKEPIQIQIPIHNQQNNVSTSESSKANASQLKEVQVIERSANKSEMYQQAQIQEQVRNHTINYELAEKKRVVEYQISKSKEDSQIDYTHIKDFAFMIKDTLLFYIIPDHDLRLKGQINLYWEKNAMFMESTYEVGEEVVATISENGRMIYGNEFFRAAGFSLNARKGNKYQIKFVNHGMNKLVTLVTSNYLSEVRTQNKVTSEHANEHQKQTQKIVSTLINFLSKVQKNLALNQQIAYNVSVVCKRYLMYQICEMFLVVIAACLQVYLVKGLLNPHSIV